MADKMTCPACTSHTSTIREAFLNGDPCPVCGLSAAAAMEIDTVRASRADAALREKYEQAVVHADRAEAEVSKLQRRLGRIERAMKDEPDEEW